MSNVKKYCIFNKCSLTIKNGHTTLLEIINLHELKTDLFSKCLVKYCFVRVHFRHQITWGIGLNTCLKGNRTVRFVGNGNSRTVGPDPGSNFGLTHPYVG